MTKKQKPPAAANPHGPHHWGNGPKPYGIIKRLALKLQGK
jgi:hypothetical protein